MFHLVLRKKWLAAIASIFLLLSAFSACGSSSSNNGGGNTSNNTTPITIGFATSLTGDFSADGKSTLQGYQYWAKTVNNSGGLLGHQVKLDWLDDKSDPTTVMGIYSTLIKDHHDDLVLGPFGFSTAEAGHAADRYGYAMMQGSGSTPNTFKENIKNLFSVSLSTKHYFKTFAQYLLSLPPGASRPKTAAYAAVNDDFALPPVDEARQMLEQAGVQTVYQTQYENEQTDTGPIPALIAAKNPDIVILGTEDPGVASTIIQKFKQQHYNPRAIIELSGPDQGQTFTQAIGGIKVAEGIFVPNAGWWPESKTYQNDQFVKGFIATYGGSAADITSDEVQAFSCGQVLQQAVEKAHSIDNKALLNVLHNLNNSWNTIQGPVRFNDAGENVASIAYLFQWQGGQLVPVYPAGQAQKNPEYPKTPW